MFKMKMRREATERTNEKALQLESVKFQESFLQRKLNFIVCNASEGSNLMKNFIFCKTLTKNSSLSNKFFLVIEKLVVLSISFIKRSNTSFLI